VKKTSKIKGFIFFEQKMGEFFIRQPKGLVEGKENS